MNRKLSRKRKKSFKKRHLSGDIADSPFFQQAVSAFQYGRFRETLEKCRLILADHPSHAVALNLAGQAAFQIGDVDLAIEYMQMAVDAAPENTGNYNDFGAVLVASGNIDEAVSNFRQAVAIDPKNAVALNSLGVQLHTLNQLDEAETVLSRAVEADPDFAMAYNSLGGVLQDRGRLDEAGTAFRRAIDCDPGYAAAYSNLGILLKESFKFDDAVTAFHKALAINPDFAEARNNLGNAFKALGRLDEAVANYAKALAIKPNYAQAQCNLGDALKRQGKLDEAVQVLQAALEKNPGNNLISNHLIGILNDHVPNTGIHDAYIEAQGVLQRIKAPNCKGAVMIADETVRQFYQQCHSILDSLELRAEISMTQLFRGVSSGHWKNFSIVDCSQHMTVFETFNIIPEDCFNCYKIYIEPRSVVELFKLMVVIRNLELPSDNTRKCIVENRPEIPGAYKGFIYCQSLGEGKDILKVVQTAVGEKISKKTPVTLKRGCSEFKIAYPEYDRIGDNGAPPMTYNEEWREHEDEIDKKLAGERTTSYTLETHNHSGFTLRDALVMHTWLAYAAAIGDLSYLKISNSPVRPLLIEKRPPFQPAADE